MLGEVAAVRDGRPLVLGSARPRSVLAALLLDANRVVTVDDVIGRVWGEEPPHQVRSSLHSYFTRLRSALGGEATIVRRGHGYMLRADGAAIDVHRFHESAVLARVARRPADALTHVTAALDQWRGTPFAGLDSAWLADVRTTLEAERDEIVLQQTDLRLELGQHTQLVVELERQADASPRNERLATQLMLALYRSGRQADALQHFQRIRTALADELGIDPGAALRALHQSILEEDPALLVSTEPDAPAARVTADPGQRPIVPRQLPSAVLTFVGRERELAALSAVLTPAGTATRMAVIAGTGGMGKTSLAVQWAHQHSDQFPDGQLFVNLRGFDTSLDPVSASQAMRSFLLAFQVEPQAIPENPQALAGLYRSVLADKRVLIVLDNARDTGQVTALVPGSPGCSVLATSRNRLTSLISSHDSHLLPLDVLDARDARMLLTERLGPRRSATEVAAIDELVALCGGLPLALSITVGRVQEHPEFPMSALVGELHDAGSALSALDADPDLSIRTVLSASDATLSAAQAEAFRLLGLAPGPDIGLPAASALLGRSYAATRTLLRELERASLVRQHTPGRFRMHDLVGLYAREQAEQHVPSTDREAALLRLAEFYLHTSTLAAELADPGSPRMSVGNPVDGHGPLPLRDAEEAWRWFGTEEQNLRAVHDVARRFDWHELVWQVPWTTGLFYDVSGRMFETIESWYAALEAARALGDLDKLSVAHRMIARGVSRNGDEAEALRNIEAAARTARQSGNITEQILTSVGAAEVHCRRGRVDLAVAEGTRAWQLAQGQSRSLRLTLAANLAWAYALDQEYDRSRDMATIALDLCTAREGREVRMKILDTLGFVARRTGKLQEAIGHLHAAHELCPPSDTFSLADILCSLGETCFELGRHAEAERHLKQALRMYREQRRAQDVSRVETVLDRMNGKSDEDRVSGWPYG